MNNLNIDKDAQLDFVIESVEHVKQSMIEIYNDPTKENVLIYKYFCVILKNLPAYRDGYIEWLQTNDNQTHDSWENSIKFINHTLNKLIRIKNNLNSNRE